MMSRNIVPSVRETAVASPFSSRNVRTWMPWLSESLSRALIISTTAGISSAGPRTSTLLEFGSGVTVTRSSPDAAGAGGRL